MNSPFNASSRERLEAGKKLLLMNNQGKPVMEPSTASTDGTAQVLISAQTVAEKTALFSGH
jgi:hypothetical protein